MESVLIEELSKVPEECLNLKNKWAGSKLPGLVVKGPKTKKLDTKGPDEGGEQTARSLKRRRVQEQ